MRRATILVALLVATLGCSKTKEEKITDLFDSGMEHADAYRLAQAREKFDQISEIDPAEPRILFGRGLMKEHQWLLYDALHDYMILVDHKPDFAPAHLRIHRILTRLGEFDDATQAAGNLAEAEPGSVRTHLTMAEALSNIGQHSRARGELEKAQAAGASPAQIDLEKARTFLRQQRPDSAAAIMETVEIGRLKVGGEVAAYARFLEESGEVDLAIRTGYTAVLNANYSYDVMLEQFERLVRNDYRYWARRLISDLKERGADSTLLIGLRLFYEMAGRQERVARYYATDYVNIFRNEISSWYYEMQTSGALWDVMSVGQNQKYIRATMQRNDYLIDFRKFMQYRLAVFFAAFDDELAAIKELDMVMGMRGGRPEVKVGKAALMYQRGQYDEVEEMIDNFKKFNGNNPRWLTAIGDIYSRRHVRHTEKALPYYRQALESDRWYRPAFEKLLQALEYMHRIDEGMQAFDTYNYLVERYPDIAAKKVLWLVKSDRFEEGLQQYKNLAPTLRGNLRLVGDLVRELKKDKRTEEIAELMRLESELNPENPDALSLVASHAADMGEYQTAVELADKSLAIESDNQLAPVAKARGLYGLGRVEEAIALFDQTRAKAPHNGENAFYYARLLADEDRDLILASNLSRRALAESGGNLREWLNLCSVYYQMGRYDLCLGEARKATSKYRREPEPRFYLAMGLLKTDRKGVKKTFQESIDLGLSGEHLEIARKHLAEL